MQEKVVVVVVVVVVVCYQQQIRSSFLLIDSLRSSFHLVDSIDLMKLFRQPKCDVSKPMNAD